MSWTDDRIETLKKLWQDGVSDSQIAKQLGGVTRNAVLSKRHALGLCRQEPSAPVIGGYSKRLSQTPSL